MAARKAKKSPHHTQDGYAYLTKRMVVRKATRAGQEASTKAMDAMGYVVTTEGSWVVRKFKDGRVEKITNLEERIN